MDFYNQRMDGEFIYAMLFALLDSANNNSHTETFLCPWYELK